MAVWLSKTIRPKPVGAITDSVNKNLQTNYRMSSSSLPWKQPFPVLCVMSLQHCAVIAVSLTIINVAFILGRLLFCFAPH